jgi:hypothetical protein
MPAATKKAAKKTTEKAIIEAMTVKFAKGASEKNFFTIYDSLNRVVPDGTPLVFDWSANPGLADKVERELERRGAPALSIK